MKKLLSTFSQRRSPLSNIQSMNVKKGGKKSAMPELGLALPLTSLIDAFSIIVIYLLVGTQGGNGIEVKTGNNIQLPTAAHATSITRETAILKIEKGSYFLNDKIVSVRSLTQKLTELKKNSKEKDVELLIQADTKMQFSDLDPLIKAGSLAGIEKLKFAVVPE